MNIDEAVQMSMMVLWLPSWIHSALRRSNSLRNSGWGWLPCFWKVWRSHLHWTPNFFRNFPCGPRSCAAAKSKGCPPKKPMAFRYNLVHHPEASQDYHEAFEFFHRMDDDLAALFADDFRTALRGIASGRARSHLYASGHALRWVKLKRFSHKIFFEPDGEDTRLVLAVMSGRRDPSLIKKVLGSRSDDEK